MKVTFNSINNLGTVSIVQTKQSKQSFHVEVSEADSKQEKIEASRKSYTEFVQSCNAIYQGATPTQLVDKQTNSITIMNGVYYHLGSINGKPLNGTALTGGGFNSNFSPMIQWTGVGTKVTPEQEAAFRIQQSYSQAERQGANELVHVFMRLARMTDGNAVANANKDKMFAQHFPKFAEGVGLDLSKPFTINGKPFMYSKGVLQALNNEV